MDERKNVYDMRASYNTMSFAYTNPGLGRGGCVCCREGVEELGWKTVGVLICLCIRDNAWVYGSKEERKKGEVRRKKG
jgi:hypothetical protein